MRDTLIKSINEYLVVCQNTDWIKQEAYKFEFANYINSNVNWSTQTDEQILFILEKSQSIKFYRNTKGVQFIIKSGREKLTEFIKLEDVRLLRRVNNENPENLDWSKRGMSYTGLSAWLSSLFPEKFYPVPLKGFNDTINYLFETGNEPFPKQGKEYIFHCQSFLKKTGDILKKYPIEELFLKELNEFFKDNPELNILPKVALSKLDWLWIVQDFHLFVHRNILKLYGIKGTDIEVQSENEPTAFEGESALASHIRYERNIPFIKRIKKQALSRNKMLNCVICGFSFLGTYGEIGAGFIEGHHLNQLSKQGGKTKLSKAEEIVLVCSNCHRMIHSRNPLFTPVQLKDILDRNK
jgi:hypothetical protein